MSAVYAELRMDRVELEPLVERPGDFRLTGPRGSMVVGATILQLAREFDGALSCAQITRDLMEQGVPLPGPDFVLGLAKTLAKIGAVELYDAPPVGLGEDPETRSLGEHFRTLLADPQATVVKLIEHTYLVYTGSHLPLGRFALLEGTPTRAALADALEPWAAETPLAVHVARLREEPPFVALRAAERQWGLRRVSKHLEETTWPSAVALQAALVTGLAGLAVAHLATPEPPAADVLGDTFVQVIDLWFEQMQASPALEGEEAYEALLESLVAAVESESLEAAEVGWIPGRVLYGKRKLVVDLNHHLTRYLFERLSPSERLDEHVALTRIYAWLEQLGDVDSSYLNETWIQTTSTGKRFLERHFWDDARVATPATLLFDHHDPKRLREELEALAVREDGRPAIIIKKNLLQHRGEGIEVYMGEGLEAAVEAAEHHDLFQAFLYCPYPDGHQRNYRLVLVGDEPATLYDRRAPQPLVDPESRALLSTPPPLDAVLTNRARGGTITTHDPHSRPELLELARAVRRSFEEAERAFRAEHEIDLPFVGIDVLSVDAMLDAEGRAYLNEIHLAPELMGDDYRWQVARAMARHIATRLEEGNFDEVLMLGKEPLRPMLTELFEAQGTPVTIYDAVLD